MVVVVVVIVDISEEVNDWEKVDRTGRMIGHLFFSFLRGALSVRFDVFNSYLESKRG